MSRSTREEVLPRLRQRYINRGREGRSRLLDEVCEPWGFSRKHADRADWEGSETRATPS